MYASQTMKGEKTARVDLSSKWKIPVEKLAGLLFKTNNQTFDKQEILRFEISSKKMDDLFLNHQICAADIHCLDENSKRCLKKLCLKTCLHNASLT
jgi:hypothetical protein